MALTYQQLLTAIPLVLRAGNVPNIVGDAGIGKSALVKEVAHKMGAKLFTTVVSLSEKGDLAIPVPPLTSDSFIETKNYGRLANVQFGYSETLVSIIQAAEKEPAKPLIWFLDEFNRGTQAVQSELMNLVLQRQINSLRLPDAVKIIIAENPDPTMQGFEDREYGVAIGDDAIKDRTVRLVMGTSTKEWLTWARQPVGSRSRINPLVIQYLQEYPERLAVIDSENPDLKPTPRAWERVSRNLDQLEQLPVQTQQQLAPDLFTGDLGTEVGVSFAQFALAGGSKLTVKAIRDTSQGVDDFKKSNDATKIHLLRQWISGEPASLSTEPGADRFMLLLNAVSADGQYAVAQSIGDHLEDVLQPLYAQAVRDPQGKAAELYHRLAIIATRGDDR